jgi:hypothetical protein
VPRSPSRSSVAWSFACLTAAATLPACSALLDLDVQYTDAGPQAGDASGAGDDAAATTPAGDASDATIGSTPPAGGGGNDGPGALETSVPPFDATVDAPALPPIQFVQAAAAANTNGGNVVTVPLPHPVAAGDTIIVGADATAGADIGVTDSFGSVYTIAFSTDDGQGVEGGIAYAINVAGGTEAVTFTLDSDGSTQFFEVYVHEYSGIGALDAATGQVGTSPTLESGFVTTTAANDLIFGYAVTGSATAGDGFTSRLTFNSNLTEDENLQAPGPVEATAKLVGGDHWIMEMAAFEPR